MKIISSYYWGLTLLKRGFTFWKRGVHFLEKRGFTFMKNNIGGGVRAFEKRVHISEKGVH